MHQPQPSSPRPFTLGFILFELGLLVRALLAQQQVNLLYSYSTIGGAFYEKIHPGTYLLVMAAGAYFVTGRRAPLGRLKSVVTALLLASAASCVWVAVNHQMVMVGYALDTLLCAVAAIFCVVNLTARERQACFQITATVVLVLVCTVYLERFAHVRLAVSPPMAGRASGVFEHPLAAGIACVAAIPLLAFARWRPIFKIFGVLFLTGGALMAGARMASVGSMILVVLLAPMLLRGDGSVRNERRVFAMFALLLCAFASVALASTLETRLSLGFNDESARARFLAGQYLFQYINPQDFWKGTSAETIAYMSETALRVSIVELPILLFILTDGAIVGFFVYSVVGFSFLRTGFKAGYAGAVSAIVIFAVANTSNGLAQKNGLVPFVVATLAAASLERRTRSVNSRPVGNSSRLPSDRRFASVAAKTVVGRA